MRNKNAKMFRWVLPSDKVNFAILLPVVSDRNKMLKYILIMRWVLRTNDKVIIVILLTVVCDSDNNMLKYIVAMMS